MTASNAPGRIHDLEALRDRIRVFRDRVQAGSVLAEMLGAYRSSDALVLGIPAGGLPVAGEIARRLDLKLDVAVVSKILLPWTTEAGFGAVAFDGSVWINRDQVARFDLTPEQVTHATAEARAKVKRRVTRLRGDGPWPVLDACTVIIVDDGIAAGSTLRAAVAALHRHGASRLVIAVPTGHADAVHELAREATDVYCANLRRGNVFAVADAYETWVDITEDEAATLLRTFRATA